MPARKTSKTTRKSKTTKSRKSSSKRALPAKRGGKKQALARTRPKPKGPSLLILECDAEKLASQSLNLGSAVYALISRWAVGLIRTEIVRSTSEQDLLEKMAQCKEKHDSFDLILVVGHSNSAGLQLTAEKFVQWSVFANWIETFKPKRLLLVACKSGGWLSAKDIFENIKKLKEIYASPGLMSRQQATTVLLLVFYFLLVKTPNLEHILIAQSINLFRSGGLLYRWTRKECKDEEMVEGMKWDLLAHLKELLFRGGLNF